MRRDLLKLLSMRPGTSSAFLPSGKKMLVLLLGGWGWTHTAYEFKCERVWQDTSPFGFLCLF